MSIPTTPQPPTIARIGSLKAALASENVVTAARFAREVWWHLRPAFLFALRVAALTLLLGLSRWADFDSVRANNAAADTSRPTMLRVIDAFDSVLTAAETVGSSGASARLAMWVVVFFAIVAVVFSVLSIMASRETSVRLRRSFGVLPRRIVREIFAVLIACGILAHVAGKPDYLFYPQMWSGAVLIALVMGLTILAEQRWMNTSASFVVGAPLPLGGAAAVGMARVTDFSPRSATGAAAGGWAGGPAGGSAGGPAGGSAGGGPVDPKRSE